MAYFCIGLVRGYSAPAVPSMKELNPDLLPTKYIASWASMFIVKIFDFVCPIIGQNTITNQ